MLALPNNLEDDVPTDGKAAAMARVWLARLDMQTTLTTPVMPLPADFSPAMLAASLAELVALIMGKGKTLLLALPDDQLLPELSNALDLVLRPLCLVVPAAPFASRIVVRATLSLLKGRMGRGLDEDADSGQVQAWRLQQQRLDVHSATWQACLAWAASDDREGDWPADLVALFPVVIVGGFPQPAATQVGGKSDPDYAYATALTPARLPERLAPRQLLLQATQRQGALIRSDEEALLQAEMAILTQEVGDMELELATIQSEVGEFARHYYERVGALLTELDTLRAEQAADRAERTERKNGDDASANTASTARENAREYARQEAREAQDRAERSRREHSRYTEYAAGEAPPFRPSRDIKRLFRRIAQKIHPDRADDEADRQWRTQLMSEANRAYRCNDEAALRDVLARWQKGRHGEHRGAADALPTRQELADRIEKVRMRLAEIEAELHRLFTSPLYELFIAARLARRQGRELLEEMAADLAGQIAEARQK
jgi:hypothetical protein